MAKEFSQQNILFSASRQGEVKNTDSITLLSDRTGISRLLSLVQAHGSLVIAKHSEGLRVKLGPYHFMVTLTANRAAITFEDVMDMSTSMAALFLKMADIFFPHRADAFKVKAPNLNSEFMVWQQAREAQIKMMPTDDVQQSRFSAWEQAARAALRNKSSFFKPEDVIKQSQSSAPGIMRPTPKMPHSVSIYLDEGTVSPLADLIYEYGDFSLLLRDGVIHMHIHEQHLSIVVEHSRVSLNLLDIDLSRPGAAEMMAKILDAFFFDRERRLRLNIHSEDALRNMYGMMQKYGIFVDATDPKQAKLLSQFAKAWLSGNQKAVSSLFESLREHENQKDDGPTPGA